MRPPNEDRVVVEYVRIHRIVDPGLFTPEPFAEDVLARLRDAVRFTSSWRKRTWRLGNIQERPTGASAPVSISGELGWSDEVPSADAPPPYNETTHSWPDEPAQVRSGVLALFTLDVGSQVAAVTSLAGDLPMPGFCHALTGLLEQAEMSASADAAHAGLRVKREWLVEPIDERGTFEAWVQEVDKVTRLSTAFHLPNPRTRDELTPIVDLLQQIGAERGTVSAASADGLDPYGHPLMVSAIAMQEHDYGTITADGVLEDGSPRPFRSREHPVRDEVQLDPEDPPLSVPGVAALLLRKLAQKLEQGLR